MTDIKIRRFLIIYLGGYILGRIVGEDVTFMVALLASIIIPLLIMAVDALTDSWS